MVKLPAGLTDYSKKDCHEYNRPKVYEYEGKKTANPVILNDSWKLSEGSNLVQRYFRKDCEPFENYDGRGNYARGKETKHFQSERKVKDYLKREAKKTQNPKIQPKSSSAWTPSESVALKAGVKAHGASEYPPLFKPEPPPIAAAWKRVPPADPPSPENG